MVFEMNYMLYNITEPLLTYLHASAHTCKHTQQCLTLQYILKVFVFHKLKIVLMYTFLCCSGVLF